MATSKRVEQTHLTLSELIWIVVGEAKMVFFLRLTNAEVEMVIKPEIHTKKKGDKETRVNKHA